MKDSYVVLPGYRPTINKPASAVKVYGVDVVDIIDDNDVVASATATASDVSLAGTVAIDGTIIKALISGGTPGQVGSVRFDFTTQGGTSDSVTIYFRII